MSSVAENLVDQRFTRLIVFARAANWKRRGTYWVCACDCGNYTIASTQNLKSGRHKSCGCYRGGPTAHTYIEKTTSSGYVFVKRPGHPRAHPRTGRVREHILIMEELLGRHLLPGEEVHHKNGLRADNSKENLELWVRSQPAGARVSDLVQWATTLLRTYAPERLTIP